MSTRLVLPRISWALVVIAAFTTVSARLTDRADVAEARSVSVGAPRTTPDVGMVIASAEASGRTPPAPSATIGGSAPTPSVPGRPTALPGVERAVVAALVPAVVAAVAPAGTEPGWPGPTDPALQPAHREHIPRPAVVSDPARSGLPWGDAVRGLLTFRGNPTRTYFGSGPVPADPHVVWKYPGRAMCGNSSEYGVTKLWCGTGWTGQPAVFERDGRTWVVFGAYDHRIHFVDAATGADIIPPFPTGDIAKGAITVDPDGYPLIYAGSRDNKYRVIAFDRPVPTELWSLDSHSVGPRLWNDDWDAAGLVVDDWLIEGGENSRLHLIKLNRGYGSDGLVTADPVLAWHGAGWDDRLLADVGDVRVSLESSVMLLGDIAYVASSGGLVQGWDVSVMRTGEGTPHRVFRFWTGDDTDATIVGDAEGFVYVGVEVDRNLRRSREVGQLLKLDPRHPDDPVVWAVNVNSGVDSGTWSTPAIVGDTIVWPTKPGRVYGLDRATGAIRWEFRVPGPVLSSPAIVDGVLLQADGRGVLHAYGLGDGTALPPEIWRIALDANIESTPAVWNGRIYVGDRSGFMYAIGDG